MKTPIKKLDTRWFLNTQYNNNKIKYENYYKQKSKKD